MVTRRVERDSTASRRDSGRGVVGTRSSRGVVEDEEGKKDDKHGLGDAPAGRTVEVVGRG